MKRELVVFIVFVVGLAGCRVQSPAPVFSVSEKPTYTPYNIQTDPDSALIAALVECDSNGLAQMKQIEALSRLISTHAVVTNGKLLVKTIVKKDTITVIVPGKDIEKIVQVNILTDEQKRKIAAYPYLIGLSGLLLILLGVLIFKK